MKAHGWFKEELEKVQDSFEFKQEMLELEVTERILEEMERQGINRAELAKRLGVSRAAVSKLLNHGSNMTLKRLLGVAEALGCDVSVRVKPRLRAIDGC